ncbi:response regulator transcription factor [Flavobacteriaceae bacterium]|nr:response regulator transcription factor [Flavobacteriaceae bacterium]MDC1496013.1 response regulator transcription factor [Flavobacteriaceae bacterium]
MIKILIADAHPIVRMGLSMVVNSAEEFQLQDAVATTTQLFTAVEKQIPDIVILEMDIPEINGIATVRKLKEINPNIKVLIFSSQSETVYALSTIRAGACGYLSKTARIDQILTALTQLKEGKIYLTHALSEQLKKEKSGDKEKSAFRKLSSREIEVLKLLASGKKNKEVAGGLDINEKTVSTYKSRLMKKLNVTNIVDMLQHAKALQLY